MYNQKCEHELKHNKDTDIVFCVKCGERWEKGRVEYILQYIDKPAEPIPYVCPICHMPNCTGHTCSW